MSVNQESLWMQPHSQQKTFLEDLTHWRQNSTKFASRFSMFSWLYCCVRMHMVSCRVGFMHAELLGSGDCSLARCVYTVRMRLDYFRSLKRAYLTGRRPPNTLRSIVQVSVCDRHQQKALVGHGCRTSTIRLERACCERQQEWPAIENDNLLGLCDYGKKTRQRWRMIRGECRGMRERKRKEESHYFFLNMSRPTT